MNKKKMIYAFLFVLGMLCAAGQVSAQTQIPITQGCYVTIESNRYIVHFSLPDYMYEDEDGNDYEEGDGDGGDDDGCGTFSEIVMYNNEDYDVTDIPGYPALPFLSMDLLLPECAENIIVTSMAGVTTYDNPPHYISPAFMGSEVDENGDVIEELDEDCYNIEYYTSGATADFPYGFYNHESYTVSDIYTESGYKGFTFSIFPFSYHPENGQMEVLREMQFIIEFDCGDLDNTIAEIQETATVDATAAQLYFDTFNGMDIVPHTSTGENGSYLIIASHRDMEGSLSQYVQYKQSQNFNTEVIYLDDFGALGDRMMIELLIKFNVLLPNPDYVLLVGSLNDIPPYSGTGTGAHPFTDDGYHPRLGRWIISSYSDLDNIINKTIATETGYGNTLSTAALFSGKDSKKRRSKFFYNDIKKIANASFSDMGIPYMPHNGRTIPENNAQTYMWNAIQNHPRFFIYSGHGYSPSWSGIARPYEIFTTASGYNNLYQLANQAPHPMGFGFACHLNSYTTDNNFGARWVAKPDAGGVTFYGSTITSSMYPDRYLSKKVFTQLRKITNKMSNFPISLWLRVGEDKYYNALKVVWRRRQVKKYNLIGDPTLAVYGMNYSGTYEPFHTPERETIANEATGNELSVAKKEIYDISGKKITSIDGSVGIETLPLQPGVYVVKTIFMDGSFETNKIIK